MKTWMRRTAAGLGVLVALVGGAAAVLELRPPKMRAVDRRKSSRPPPSAWRAAVTSSRRRRTACIAMPTTTGRRTARRCCPASWARDGTCRGPTTRCPGRVFAPNITPDRETGIGAVPDDAVARAIREGVSRDGRALFMMPWENYRHFSDEEVASVVAYLRTLPPVKRARGTTAISAPVRWFLKSAPEPLTAPVAEADASDPIARGKHLADIGQCQTCHTPVDARHQPLAGMAYSGGQEFTIDGIRYRSANITPHPSGISYYTEELFIRAMRTGNVGARRLAPIMPWAYDSQADRR